MSDAMPRADEVDDALDGAGWVLAGPLLQVSPGVWSLDLLPVESLHADVVRCQ